MPKGIYSFAQFNGKLSFVVTIHVLGDFMFFEWKKRQTNAKL